MGGLGVSKISLLIAFAIVLFALRILYPQLQACLNAGSGVVLGAAITCQDPEWQAQSR